MATELVKLDKNAVQLAKLSLKQKREERQMQLLQQVIGSPIFQIVGTVAACELMEKAEIISSGWSTAMETGAIALVGLHTLKNYGVLGLGIAGTAGLTAGALSHESELLNKANMNVSDFIGASGGFPGAVWNLIRSIF